MTAPRVDEVRYDLSALDAAERVVIINDLEESDINHQFEDGVLTIGRGDEAAVDQIIEEAEEWGEQQREYRQQADTVLAGGASPDQARCEGFDVEYCGNSPAAVLVLRRQVGQVIMSTNYQVQLALCDACGEKAFKDFQKQTAIKGWLGIRSAAMNPVVMVANLKNRQKHRKALGGASTDG